LQPVLPETIPWPEVTRAWWAALSDSPESKSWSVAQWLFLLDTALLHADIWSGNLDRLPEMRVRLIEFGMEEYSVKEEQPLGDRPRFRLRRIGQGRPPRTSDFGPGDRLGEDGLQKSEHLPETKMVGFRTRTCETRSQNWRDGEGSGCRSNGPHHHGRRDAWGVTSPLD
jgi:hypothetical protein